MKVYYNIEDYKQVPNAVVTIGTFDGVHRGHQEILKNMVNRAKELDGESVVVTFYPHPRQVLSNDSGIRFISTQQEKISHLEALGIDNLIIINFTKEFAAISSEDFIKDYLVKNIHPAVLIIGYDHHFGKGRTGDFEMLYELGNRYNFKVEKIQEQDVENVAVSSTKIRHFLENGDIKHANMLLGYEFSYTGKVVHGQQVGQKMGYPTANIDVAEEFQLIERQGVYATFAEIDGKSFPAMTYIGKRPTMHDERPQSIETYIIGFDGNLYDKEIKIRFVDFVRDDKKFDNFEALKHQIDIDKQQIINILNKKI
ncbi:MAG: bifunctional riboflavin kinase/FAD synthetase [Bacteroidales bacterium]|nr:bifunctional riboflavin kinase/FAD synthetase [Bacteroidales bacterium]